MTTLPPHGQNGKPAMLHSPVDSSHQHYVYTLAYPDAMGGRVFYVGKGTGNRIDAHEYTARQSNNMPSYKINTIRKIWKAGHQIVKTKMAFFESHQEACAYEVALIFFMDGLTNMTAGGDGVLGLTHSDEVKRKISEHNKQRPQEQKVRFTFRGRTHTEESRRKSSESHKGMVISEEHRRKLSQAGKGRPHSEEHKHHISQALKGHAPSEETRQKISKSEKGRIAHNKGKPMTEAQRGKLRDAAKNRKPASEETRRKMSTTHKSLVISEETRRKAAEANRGQKRSAEVRAKMSEAAKLRAARKRAQSEQIEEC